MPAVLRRAGIIALLVFQLIWLNVILPGHTRGIITVPGYQPTCDDSSGSSCCAPKKSDGRSDNDRKAHCAVCFFAARLTLPPTIDLTPAPLELLEVREAPAAESAFGASLPLTCSERGPPAV